MSCPIGAVNAASRDGDQMRVFLVERRIFQEQEHIRLNPEAQRANGQQHLCILLPAVVDLFETGTQRGGLHVGWQLRQQERMADADFVAVEDFHHGGNQVNQLEAMEDIRGWFADCRRDLLDGVLRLLHIEKRLETLRLFHWVYRVALEIFN